MKKRPVQPGDGKVYDADGLLSIWYYGSEKDAKGKLKRHFLRTGLSLDKRKQAEETLARIRLDVLHELRTGLVLDDGTIQGYGERWLKTRAESGYIRSFKDDIGRLRLHVWPLIGKTPMKDADGNEELLRDLVRNLRKRDSRKGGKLANRYVRNIYGLLKTMFRDAVVERVIYSTPCVLKRKDLPKKIDKDPLFRDGAMFTREEAEMIMSDERIPLDRRVLYAILFFAALRFGEAAALPWSAYDSKLEPLGKFWVAVSFDSKTKTIGPLKTEVPRKVPVHSELADVLRAWRREWERFVGRPPGPDDLIIPREQGDCRRATRSLKLFHQDLAAIGLRPRRVHDMRSVLATFGLVDGAKESILNWIIWGPPASIAAYYSRYPWPALCAQVSCFKLGLREGKLLPLRLAASAGAFSSFQGDSASDCDGDCDGEKPKSKISSNRNHLPAFLSARSTGLENEDSSRSSLTLTDNTPIDQESAVGDGDPGGPSRTGAVTTVTPGFSPGGGTESDTVLSRLSDAAEEWRAERDAKRLRKKLTALLVALDVDDEGGES